MSTIDPRITDVLSRTFKVPVAEIHPEATMDGLDMDSLAAAEFAVVLRETTGVELETGTLTRGTTLAELTAHLHAAVGTAR
ncbi:MULTISPECIES: acyl carrier protein [unclassified Streptomyces]|uniref:acyl carrier protein n=1 Tax=unclassified Streptomyces TaxID=2593676 RepID=UPI002E2AF62B|nr:acyl carrier protein [Streptomyces sp. NBC_01423]WSX89390.1 acyl carrier protein [Streptomyces sp. NBC_00891]WSY03869.1 acyl carrier protein [Streptomyces sp. NBC_00890]WSZ05495.1 acyl carrier protein [Streptomyces sp. NBC_00869]WSZ27009.1 acyl carrier protein [Streptomyces sp. NBC_00870]